ncbi:MAG: class I SAM-dependent methyltransferase [Clostridia bacterium]|nr:class I SAM-dependent methyltransferase [Clostridia bacterium]
MANIDWNRLWKEGRNSEAESGSSEYWDGRASSFRKKSDEPDPYAEIFYEYMDAKAGDTLFDMGCGSGTLAIPFAKKGHEVWAADFSREMLNCMMADAEAEGVADMIHPIQLDWAEDWSARDLPKCDIAFASRSMFFDELTESLDKLESVARRCCCLGAWDGPGEGLSSCYVTMGELMSRDKKPELRYIRYPFHSDRRGEDFEANTGFIKWKV